MQILKAEIRDKITDAAIQVFYEYGYDKASMRRIAAVAGISTSNLYSYFGSKKELFRCLLSPVLEELNRLLEEVACMEPQTKFSAENIEFVANTFAQLLRKHRYEFLIIMDKSEGTEFSGIKEQIVDMLESSCQETMQISEGDDTILLRIMFGNLIEGMMQILRQERDEDWTERNISDLIRYHEHSLAQFMETQS